MSIGNMEYTERLEEECEYLGELLEKIAASDVEYEDLQYTSVQIDNKTWQKIQNWLREIRKQ